MGQKATYRAVAGALALLWLALPVGGAIHASIETHQYCAEHGAFEHVPDAQAHTHGEVADDVRMSASQSDAHDECAFEDACFRSGVTVAPAQTHTVEFAAAIEPVSLGQVDASLLSVLTTAPKTSPPLA